MLTRQLLYHLTIRALVEDSGIEPETPDYRSDVLPIKLIFHWRLRRESNPHSTPRQGGALTICH